MADIFTGCGQGHYHHTTCDLVADGKVKLHTVLMVERDAQARKVLTKHYVDVWKQNDVEEVFNLKAVVWPKMLGITHPCCGQASTSQSYNGPLQGVTNLKSSALLAVWRMLEYTPQNNRPDLIFFENTDGCRWAGHGDQERGYMPWMIQSMFDLDYPYGEYITLPSNHPVYQRGRIYFAFWRTHLKGRYDGVLLHRLKRNAAKGKEEELGGVADGAEDIRDRGHARGVGENPNGYGFSKGNPFWSSMVGRVQCITTSNQPHVSVRIKGKAHTFKLSPRTMLDLHGIQPTFFDDCRLTVSQRARLCGDGVCKTMGGVFNDMLGIASGLETAPGRPGGFPFTLGEGKSAPAAGSWTHDKHDKSKHAFTGYKGLSWKPPIDGALVEYMESLMRKKDHAAWIEQMTAEEAIKYIEKVCDSVIGRTSIPEVPLIAESVWRGGTKLVVPGKQVMVMLEGSLGFRATINMSPSDALEHNMFPHRLTFDDSDTIFNFVRLVGTSSTAGLVFSAKNKYVKFHLCSHKEAQTPIKVSCKVAAASLKRARELLIEEEAAAADADATRAQARGRIQRNELRARMVSVRVQEEETVRAMEQTRREEEIAAMTPTISEEEENDAALFPEGGDDDQDDATRCMRPEDESAEDRDMAPIVLPIVTPPLHTLPPSDAAAVPLSRSSPQMHIDDSAGSRSAGAAAAPLSAGNATAHVAAHVAAVATVATVATANVTDHLDSHSSDLQRQLVKSRAEIIVLRGIIAAGQQHGQVPAEVGVLGHHTSAQFKFLVLNCGDLVFLSTLVTGAVTANPTPRQQLEETSSARSLAPQRLRLPPPQQG